MSRITKDPFIQAIEDNYIPEYEMLLKDRFDLSDLEINYCYVNLSYFKNKNADNALLVGINR